jgi:hypothetical protein
MIVLRSDDERKLFVTIGRQYPELLRIIERLELAELRKLPVATNKEQNVGVLQGRSQMLTDIQQLFNGRVE